MSTYYSEHNANFSTNCNLNDRDIYDILHRIEHLQEHQASHVQLEILTGVLRYIDSPLRVAVDHPMDWENSRGELLTLKWYVTASGHRFMSIYDTLQEAIQRVSELERRVDGLYRLIQGGTTPQ